MSASLIVEAAQWARTGSHYRHFEAIPAVPTSFVERLAQEICRSLAAAPSAPQPARQALAALDHAPDAFDEAIELAITRRWLEVVGLSYEVTHEGAAVARYAAPGWLI